MIIRTPTDVDNLDRRIQNELEIDIKKYSDENVAKNLIELFNFPNYVINWTLKPILLCLFAFIIGFFVIDLEDRFEYIIYTVAGLYLFISVGGTFGLTLLIRKLKSDIWEIIKYTLDLMKSIITDIDKVKNQITPESKRNIFTLVFKGIIHIIIIPFWSLALTEGIPIIGKPIKWLVIKILTFLSDHLKLEEIRMKAELNKKQEEVDFLSQHSLIFTELHAQLKKTLSFSLNIAQIPLIFYFFISLLFLSILIFILNQ